MCTVILLVRPGHAWPLLLAANRDERLDRPADPPGRHWPDRPDVIAGRDRLADGSWLGLNDAGLVAGVLNRAGSLGPQDGKRSRGELVLEALDHADAEDAGAALGALRAQSYRPFYMVVADNRDALLIASDGATIRGWRLNPGLHMITARGMDAAGDRRAERHRPTFATAPAPDPGTGDWTAWIDILGRGPAEGRADALWLPPEDGFGTVSSALIALPAALGRDVRPVFLYSDARPGTAAFRSVADDS